MSLNIYDFLIDIARKVSLDIQYPIGRCVLFDTEDFDPNEMWGGVWELTAINRMPIGAGDKYALGDTGGEETHTLTVDEMPSHKHDDIHYTANGGKIALDQGTQGGYRIPWSSGSNNASHINTSNTGGGQPHNNMPPYQAFYIWKRIA